MNIKGLFKRRSSSAPITNTKNTLPADVEANLDSANKPTAVRDITREQWFWDQATLP